MSNGLLHALGKYIATWLFQPLLYPTMQSPSSIFQHILLLPILLRLLKEMNATLPFNVT